MARKQQSLRAVRLNEDQKKMVEENIGIVGFFLKKYCQVYCRARSEEMEDLKQELYIGLCRAAYEFRPELGGFAGYAIWWCRSSMARWRRGLVPVGIMRSIDGMDFVENTNLSLERWRKLLETLEPEEKILLKELRIRELVNKRTLGLRSAQYKNDLLKVILKLFRKYEG